MGRSFRFAVALVSAAYPGQAWLGVRAELHKQPRSPLNSTLDVTKAVPAHDETL